MSSFTFTGWWLKTWYPKFAQRFTDEELNELAKMLEELKKDFVEEAKQIARREARR